MLIFFLKAKGRTGKSGTPLCMNVFFMLFEAHSKVVCICLECYSFSFVR